MDSTHTDALSRTEAHLAILTRGREQHVLNRWRGFCPDLADADIDAPTELRAWVHRLPTERADRVLRHLVLAAQQQDAAALLAVIACLAPGIRALAARATITCNEAVSEVAVGILDYPVERRNSIAAGLLLDARNRLHRSRQRRLRMCPYDESTVPEARSTVNPGNDDPREVTPPAQRIVQLVCQAHQQGILNRVDAELILHTRVAGHRVKPVANELGLSTTAAYQRRSRAEARLAHLVA